MERSYSIWNNKRNYYNNEENNRYFILINYSVIYIMIITQKI